jgi:hypothetical protein
LDNLHGVLERFDAHGQIVENFILVFKSFGHLMLKALPQTHELPHSLNLELLNVFVLLSQIAFGLIFELTERQRLVGALAIDLLVKLILGIVQRLHNVFLLRNASVYLSIKFTLKLYNLGLAMRMGMVLQLSLS